MTEAPPTSIAIIGAGFCGTMVAVQLAQLRPDATITLFERNAQQDCGLAYGTADADHLLNVRAAQMGAFADQPDGFWNWLDSGDSKGRYSRDDFVPRQIYGAYLQDLLHQQCGANTRLTLAHRRIVAMTPTGTGYALSAEDGGIFLADKVVLALGNFPPETTGQGKARSPYDPAVWRAIADDGDVLIVGTGLTSLDLLVTLAKTKTQGAIHLLSRHGFLPREHAPAHAYHVKFDKNALPKTTLALLKTVRKEVAAAIAEGLTWQNAIDALRPFNQQLWQNLNHQEKRRFLQHVRAYWDVHRHRCAPQIMDVVRGLETAGCLRLHHGPIVAQKAINDGWHITWRERGTATLHSFDVRHVVSCTGPQSDFRKLDDPLVQNLLSNGLITSDPLHLGISTAEDYVALKPDGSRSEGLYALGSVLKGRLYESVAVPELRVQARDVAQNIAAACATN